jgi:Nuclease-related domain
MVRGPGGAGDGMSKLINRLRQWLEIQKIRPVYEAPDVAGGRDAELRLEQMVGSSYQFKNAHVLAGRRIPSKRQGRRREIDLIVCTPRMIHLIEVKNWSGQLGLRNGAWRQIRRSGETVDHQDLIATNRIKRDAVAEYLREQGVPVDDRIVRDHIVPKIIFMNPRLELEPAIEALPEVISRRKLDKYLGRQRQVGLAERMYSSVIEFCLEFESKLGGDATRARVDEIPAGLYERIVACLSQTATWDRLHLYGSKVITGDIVGLTVGLKTYRKPELDALSERQPIRIRWTRNGLWGLLKALTGLGRLGRLDAGNARLEISPSDTVAFHAVGEPEPKSHRLVEVQQITPG